MNDFMKLVYAMFIGVAITIFTSVTLSVAYPGPSFPQLSSNTGEPTKQQVQEEEQQYKQFEKDNALYTNNTSKIILAAAVVIFVLGVVLRKTRVLHDVISEGMLFGGFFTAVWSVIQGLSYMYSGMEQHTDRWVAVAAASIALIMVITIAQFKFAPSKSSQAKRKK